MSFWKQFAALGTDFASKYRTNPFFRTEARIVTFHVLFSAFVITGLVVSFINTSYFIGETPSMNAASQSEAALTSLIDGSFEELKYRRIRNFALLLTAIVLATLVAGYVLAQVSLSPAREALAQQKIFISNVAHELRTPLSTIQASTEVALFDNSLNDDVRETLVNNLIELDRISEIINNLLSLDASMKQERMRFRAVDITPVIAKVVRALEPLASSKDINLTARTGIPSVVWGNTNALEQIITNILKNAIAYTATNGRVSVAIEPEQGSMIEIRIEDSGAGIEPKDLAHIFEPFFRSDKARSRSQGSSGLGLAIVNELVKLHRGTITVKSILGHGTTVIVRLPKTASPRDASTHETQKYSNEIVADYSDV